MQIIFSVFIFGKISRVFNFAKSTKICKIRENTLESEIDYETSFRDLREFLPYSRNQIHSKTKIIYFFFVFQNEQNLHFYIRFSIN